MSAHLEERPALKAEGGQGARHSLLRRSAARPRQKDSIWMYDPWCFTPWYTASLTRALSEANWPVRLVCPRYHFEPGYFMQCGLEPRPGALDVTAGLRLKQPGLRQICRLAEYGINTGALTGALLRQRPEILHAQLCPLLARGITSDLHLLHLAQRRGVRVVHTVHNLLPHDGGVAPHSSARLHTRLYQLCDRLICHNADTADRLSSDFGVSPTRIDVIPHGPLFAEVVTASPAEARQRLNLHPQRFLFVAQGILAPYKGTDLLLDAWAELLRLLPGHEPRPFLLIAGRGAEDEVRALEKRIAELRISESTRLEARYIPAAELPYIYQAADVLLYPYREITTSGALMTGLNYRKPIIASDLPAFRAVVDDQDNGLVLPDSDGGAWARAMLRLLTDRALLCTLRSGASRNRRRQMQWSEIAGLTIETYAKALRTPAAG